jgi:hypothetical protein
MELWNNIISTAMMGTDKKSINTQELPADLLVAAELINANEKTDKEEKFLQIAAVAFNYRQAGVQPLHKEAVTLPLAPAEEKSYCSAGAIQVLKEIMLEESIPLLKLWLQHCYSKQQIVEPEMLPLLLETGMQQKSLQTLISTCCGKRGEWLSRFNSTWNFSSNQTAEELWQTGTPEQRKGILVETRKTDPALAREWVQQSWPQEDANTKTSFLECLSQNLSGDDISFLESLVGEKSKKVKEETIHLLKQIPNSSIIQKYLDVVKSAVSLKKEKAMLGLTSKNILLFQLPANISDDIFKTGIEKLSSQKNITDETFILYQLVSYTPPQFWESHLNASPGEVIKLFNNSEEGKNMLPAVGMAVGRFKTNHWAPYFTNDENRLYPDLIPLLPFEAQEKYLQKHFDKAADTIINYATKMKNEWSVDLTKHIFKHIAKNPYQYNRSFYNQYVDLIPVQSVTELEKCTPPEEQLRTTWSNTSDYIGKLISLKIQTIKAFNT